MDKYEKFAVWHYLADWPDIPYNEIIEKLLSYGNYIYAESGGFYYEHDMEPNELAECIKTMVADLKEAFP